MLSKTDTIIVSIKDVEVKGKQVRKRNGIKGDGMESIYLYKEKKIQNIFLYKEKLYLCSRIKREDHASDTINI